jgi:hypothetical protein
MAATRRRYPPPWQVEENPASFIVKDSKGQPLAYVYFEDEPQRRMITNRIGKDDAWQLAGRSHGYQGCCSAIRRAI